MYSNLDELFLRLGRSDFRSSFRLRRRELAYFQEKGIETIMQHAADLLAVRLFPADIPNDGKQTPHEKSPCIHSPACYRLLLPWMPGEMARHTQGKSPFGRGTEVCPFRDKDLAGEG